MTFKHLSENLHEQARPWNIRLGIEGFRYADLNRVRRLEAPLSSEREIELATVTMALLGSAEKGDAAAQHQLAVVLEWTRALAFHPALSARRHGFSAFHLPHKTDYAELVPRVRPDPALPELFRGPSETRRLRDGFDLTDARN